MSLVAASTRDVSVVDLWGRETQEFVQCYSAGTMHSGTHCHLDGFQIEAAGLASSLEEDTQQSIYLARGFLTDRRGRFFSCGGTKSSTGRA
jgi:hypothetical protein